MSQLTVKCLHTITYLYSCSSICSTSTVLFIFFILKLDKKNKEWVSRVFRVQSDLQACPDCEDWGLETTQEATLITLTVSCFWLRTASLRWTAALLQHLNILMNGNSVSDEKCWSVLILILNLLGSLRTQFVKNIYCKRQLEIDY